MNPISIFSMIKTNIKQTLFILFFSSLFIRLIYLLLIKSINAEMDGDESGYFIFGEFLLGNAPDNYFIFRAPLAGFVFTPFFLVFGSSIELARLINVIISSFYAPIIYKILIKRLTNNNIAFIVSFIWVLYPPSIFYSSFIQSESLAGLIMLCLIYFLIDNQKDISLGKILVMGIICGLLSLTRSSYYYLPYLILIYMLIKFGIKSHYLIKYSLFIMIFYTTLSPLIIYNYITFDAIIPTEPRLGYGLYVCNYDLDNPEIIKGGYYKNQDLKSFKQNVTDFPALYRQDIELKEKTINEAELKQKAMEAEENFTRSVITDIQLPFERILAITFQFFIAGLILSIPIWIIFMIAFS